MINAKNEIDQIIYKPKNKNNKIGNYEIIKTMGEGTFGKVKLAIHIPTNEKVAIKILEKSKIEDNDDLICINREISFLKNLNHINIISLYEIIENSEYYYIIMEYAENDLFSYIVQNNFLSEEIASLFYFQIINAIEHIHKYKIVHRDLKPENILLTKNNLIIKIIDFGLANSYKKKEKNNDEILLKTACGSPCYAAPEMVLGKKYKGLDVDIWSSGIILFAMVSGFLPFEDDDNESIYRKIILGKFDMPDKLSNNCKDLIYRILEGNPKKRIKIDEIKKHPFLNDASERFNKIISPYEIYYNCYNNGNFEIYNSIIDKMIEMKINGCDNKKEIIGNIKGNCFNQITTIYKLLLKKAIRNKELISNNNNNINIEGCGSLSSCKTYASSNNSKNDNNNKIKKDKNNSPEFILNNNINNGNIIKNNINIDALDKLIKIHSLNEKKINHLKKKKINFLNNNNKIKRTFIKNYEDLMNNVKKILSNRNGRNENSSSSVDINNNFNKTDANNFKGKINNILSSSNLKVNTIRFSVDAPRYILNKDTQTDDCNITEKTQRKKPLSIITSGNTFIDSYDNLIINTENNICNGNNKLLNQNKIPAKNIKKLKKVISGISSPKLNSVKTTEGNNHSLKKNNISNGNNYNKNINNNYNFVKSKNKFIQKGKLYTKTASVINHLNLMNNNLNKGKMQKKIFDFKKKKPNFRDIVNNRFLLKTFVDTSNPNSKSPFNLKAKTKKQNIKNLTNNNTPSNKNCTHFNFKEKPSPKNLENKYVFISKNFRNDKNKENNNNENITINKKKINENYKFITDSNKRNFICFTTKFCLDEIYYKIKHFFEKVNYNINKKDKTHFDICCKNNNFISIEISKIEENNVVNLYHITNNKNQFKNLIKNLIAEIGF